MNVIETAVRGLLAIIVGMGALVAGLIALSVIVEIWGPLLFFGTCYLIGRALT